MGSIRPYKSKPGWFRAQIKLKGVRDSDIFPSKGAAKAWERRTEEAILSGQHIRLPNKTLKDLLERYAKEVSKDKKGKRWEEIRLQALGRDKIASVRLRDLKAPHLSDWQKRRLEAVSGSSVRREMTLLHHVFKVAVNEWHWLTENPLSKLRRPKDGAPKDRIASEAEIALLLEKSEGNMRRVIVFALETGMRASEIAGLTASSIVGRIALLQDTKNGTARQVPLSEIALRAAVGAGEMGSYPRPDSPNPPTLFSLTAGSISTMFARLAKDLGMDGLTFHCLRRTAATRLSKRMDVLELCRMFGWHDPRIPMKHYYQPDLEALARRLD